MEKLACRHMKLRFFLETISGSCASQVFSIIFSLCCSMPMRVHACLTWDGTERANSHWQTGLICQPWAWGTRCNIHKYPATLPFLLPAAADPHLILEEYCWPRYLWGHIAKRVVELIYIYPIPTKKEPVTIWGTSLHCTWEMLFPDKLFCYVNTSGENSVFQFISQNLARDRIGNSCDKNLQILAVA